MGNNVQANGLHPAVHGFVNEVSEGMHTRDALLVEVADLRASLTVEQQLTKRLDDRIASITAERDHYMRLAFALQTRLAAVQDIIGATLDLATHEAENPGPKDDQHKLSLQG